MIQSFEFLISDMPLDITLRRRLRVSFFRRSRASGVTLSPFFIPAPINLKATSRCQTSYFLLPNSYFLMCLHNIFSV
jgi:hypothetical protein